MYYWLIDIDNESCAGEMEIEFFGLEEEAIDKMRTIVEQSITNYG